MDYNNFKVELEKLRSSLTDWLTRRTPEALDFADIRKWFWRKHRVSRSELTEFLLKLVDEGYISIRLRRRPGSELVPTTWGNLIVFRLRWFEELRSKEEK